MLDHVIATNATAQKVNSYYSLTNFYSTFCVRKHTILGRDTAHQSINPFTVTM